MYKFNHINIHQFRGFSNFNLENLGRINLIVGMNNAGKTSLLEAVSIYCRALDSMEWFATASRRGIDKNIASFITPGFAKIEYLKKDKLVFEVAIFFVPIQKGEVNMVINVSIKKGLIPSSIKFMMLKPFLELVFYQDKKILQTQYKYQQKLHKPYIIAKSDLVIEHLLYLLADAKKVNNKEMIMELS